MSKALILMGVSGCGKTTIGESLSARLGWDFIEGDSVHSPENVEKMSRGIPLTDEDRLPWLKELHALLIERQTQGKSVIVSCSALKRSYREILRRGIDDVQFVFLEGDYDTILDRMQNREGHYMRPGMLRSQFEALERPDESEALIVSIEQPVEDTVEEILRAIHSDNS